VCVCTCVYECVCGCMIMWFSWLRGANAFSLFLLFSTCRYLCVYVGMCVRVGVCVCVYMCVCVCAWVYDDMVFRAARRYRFFAFFLVLNMQVSVCVRGYVCASASVCVGVGVCGSVCVSV